MKEHIKHGKISKPSFGQYARTEVAFLGASCEILHQVFKQITSHFQNYNIGILEADHKAGSNLGLALKITDKINFFRLDQKVKPNNFQLKLWANDLDYLLVNGNHFEASQQILILDSSKDVLKKLHKLTNVKLILQNDIEISNELKNYFGTNLPPIFSFNESQKWLTFIEQNYLFKKPILNGLVLAGGKSTRMGTDKTKLKYHGDLTQINYSKQLLESVCNGKVFLSSNEQYLENENVIADSFLNLGPLSGILSAMMSQPDAAWLVMAVDMPFVTETTLNTLVQNRNTHKIATCFANGFDGFPEPLITIWEPKAYPILLQMLSLGVDCPRKTLINFDSHKINLENTEVLQNVNTMEEHKQAIISLSPSIA